MRELSHRRFLADICNDMGLHTAIEIGTHQAVFAREFMSRFNGVITLVDPWELPADDNPTFYPNFDPDTDSREADYKLAVQAMAVADAQGRVTWMCMTGAAAALSITDATIGFVYIDALHTYAAVVEDIRTWYPKVVSGGILAGHDYDDTHPDVMRAVDEFISRTGLELHVTQDDPHSWWVVKQ